MLGAAAWPQQASVSSKRSPLAAAAIIRRCGGRMRIQTFGHLIVPKSAPMWM